MTKFFGADLVLTCDSKEGVLKKAFVEVDGNRIVSVGSVESLSTEQKASLTYFKRATLMPGLINAHEHLVTKSKYTSWTLDMVQLSRSPSRLCAPCGTPRDSFATVLRLSVNVAVANGRTSALRRLLGTDS